MTDTIYATITEKGSDGTLYKKQVPYVPPFAPNHPVREYIIEAKDGSHAVLVAPGDHELARPREDGASVDEDSGAVQTGRKAKAIVIKDVVKVEVAP